MASHPQAAGRLRSSLIVVPDVAMAAAGLCVLYACLAVGHFFAIEGSARLAMSSLAALSSVGLGFLARWARARSLSPAASYQIGGLIALIALANSVTHLAIAGNAEHSINLLLIVMGSAFLLMKSRWFLAVSAAAVTSWVLVCHAFVPDMAWTHYGFAWFLTLALASFIHTVRKYTALRLEGLDRADVEKTQRLQLALHDAGREIEERLAVEQKLRRSEALKAALIASSLDAMIEIDDRGSIIRANRVCHELFGYANEQLVGRSLAETLVPEALRSAHLLGMERYLLTRTPRILGKRLELEAMHADGTSIPIELVVQPVDVDGTATSFVGFLRDLRSQKKTEEELRHARDVAETANRAKSAFLANVSHEIRTPMNAVLGMTELVLETELDGGQREFLTRSYEAGETLLRMLDGLLEISKIEAGAHEAPRTQFDPIDAVQRVVSRLAFTAERKEIELLLEAHDESAHLVLGDEGSFVQVVTNLVNNAIKFTTSGCVAVRLHRPAAGQEWEPLRVEVSDTGPGISADDHERIFRAFEQAGDSRGQPGGAGLGLAISKRLVELCAREAGREGRLTIDSAPGAGTTFSFPWWVEKAGTAAKTTERPERVLLVSASEEVLGILGRGFDAWGVEVLRGTLADVPNALASGCDLVVVDAAPSDVDGLADHAQRWAERDRARTVALLPATAVARRDRLPGSLRRLTRPAVPQTILRDLTDSRSTVAESPATPKSAGRVLSILVADDNDTNRLMVSEGLGRRGHRVTAASDGCEAVERFQEQAFDVVLMDLQMPNMDGFEATRTIRESETAAKRTPIFAMTASATAEDRQKALEHGMDDLIHKPVRISRLVALTGELGEPVETPPLPFDHDALIEQVEGDYELLDRLASVFSRTVHEDLQRLEAAILDVDSEEARRLCHKLSGSLGEFAARDALRALDAIHMIVEEGDFDAAASCRSLERLAREVESLIRALAELGGSRERDGTQSA